MIGEPGVAVGTHYPNRREVYDAEVHRQLQAGIMGTAAAGAESIVVSGGYKDDRDFGAVIIYTGHGGRDPETKRQIAHQTLKDSGNAALVTSYLQRSPVRVIRGAHAGSAFAPASGYRYDGLFRIASYGSTRGVDGFLIWQFRLEEIDPTHSANFEREALAETIVGPSARRSQTMQRIVRNYAIARKVKEWHGDCCQICGTTLTVAEGRTYSEAAHIQALGAPHDGPDVEGNILCLCPNCHVLFDAGALVLTDDLTVMSGSEVIARLRTHQRHEIQLRYVRSHRARWRS